MKKDLREVWALVCCLSLTTAAAADDLGPGDRETLQRLILAEAGGEGEVGMALVARSVLNRASLVQSGRVGPGTYLARGQSLEQIVRGRNQYQPLSDGSFYRARSSQQLANADRAIALARDTDALRARLRASGKSDAEIDRLLNATGFRTYSAFRDPTQEYDTEGFGNHRFNSDRFSRREDVQGLFESAYGADGAGAATADGPPPLVPPDRPRRPFEGSPNHTRAQRGLGTIRRVVIHVVEGPASAGVTWFKLPRSGASTHYVVGFDGAVTQLVLERDIAWHVRRHNQDTIGVDHAGYARRNQWTEAQLAASARLVGELCSDYQLEPSETTVVSHAALDRRSQEPGPFFPWETYLARVRQVKEELDRAKQSGTPAPAEDLTGLSARQGSANPAGRQSVDRSLDTGATGDGGALPPGLGNGALPAGLSPEELAGAALAAAEVPVPVAPSSGSWAPSAAAGPVAAAAQLPKSGGGYASPLPPSGAGRAQEDPLARAVGAFVAGLARGLGDQGGRSSGAGRAAPATRASPADAGPESQGGARRAPTTSRGRDTAVVTREGLRILRGLGYDDAVGAGILASLDGVSASASRRGGDAGRLDQLLTQLDGELDRDDPRLRRRLRQVGSPEAAARIFAAALFGLDPVRDREELDRRAALAGAIFAAREDAADMVRVAGPGEDAAR